MKATLEFDLNDSDDIIAHRRCVESLNMALVLWEMDNNMRKRCLRTIEAKEMNGEEMSAYDAIEFVFEEFRELLSSHHVDTDKLIV